MLTDGERAQIAAERERLIMTEQATITNDTYISDGAGGRKKSPNQQVVPCFRYPTRTGAGEPVAAGQLTQGLQWMIGFPLGTQVNNDSTIEIGGEIYDVVSVMGPYTFETARTVIARAR